MKKSPRAKKIDADMAKAAVSRAQPRPLSTKQKNLIWQWFQSLVKQKARIKWAWTHERELRFRKSVRESLLSISALMDGKSSGLHLYGGLTFTGDCFDGKRLLTPVTFGCHACEPEMLPRIYRDLGDEDLVEVTSIDRFGQVHKKMRQRQRVFIEIYPETRKEDIVKSWKSLIAREQHLTYGVRRKRLRGMKAEDGGWLKSCERYIRRHIKGMTCRQIADDEIRSKPGLIKATQHRADKKEGDLLPKKDARHRVVDAIDSDIKRFEDGLRL